MQYFNLEKNKQNEKLLLKCEPEIVICMQLKQYIYRYMK